MDSEGCFRYGNSKWFTGALEALKATGVHGMAIDVWVRCPGCPSLWLLEFCHLRPIGMPPGCHTAQDNSACHCIPVLACTCIVQVATGMQRSS